MRAVYVTGLLVAVGLQLIQGCATSPPGRLDAASLTGLWKGEVDLSRNPRRASPRVLRIAAMKGEDTAGVGHYGATEATAARVYITVARTDNRIRIRFLTDSGHRAELTMMDGERLVGYLHAASVAHPMTLRRVRSSSHDIEECPTIACTSLAGPTSPSRWTLVH